MMSNQNIDNILTPKQIVFITLSFIALIILCGLLKKLFYFIFFRRKIYLFPRISTKGISSIAMVIAISISCIIILIFLTGGIFGVLFRAYPGWRINIETILIKTGGLLYGPIVGLFIGAITDLLTIIITASSFHYGYFIVCIICGLISGLLHQIWRLSLKKKLTFCILSSVICILLCALIQIYLQQMQGDVFDLDFFKIQIKIPKSNIVWLFFSLFSFVILFIWIAYLLDSRTRLSYFCLQWKFHKKIKKPINHYLQNEKNRQKFSDWHFKFYSDHMLWINNFKNKLNSFDETAKKQQKKSSTFACFSSVLLMVVITETIINIVVVPIFDTQFSVYPFQYWFILRVVFLFIFIPLNIFIIYSIFKIIISMTRYDLYESSIFNQNQNYRTIKNSTKLWAKKH